MPMTREMAPVTMAVPWPLASSGACAAGGCCSAGWDAGLLLAGLLVLDEGCSDGSALHACLLRANLVGSTVGLQTPTPRLHAAQPARARASEALALMPRCLCKFSWLVRLGCRTKCLRLRWPLADQLAAATQTSCTHSQYMAASVMLLLFSINLSSAAFVLLGCLVRCFHSSNLLSAQAHVLRKDTLFALRLRVWSLLYV